MLLRNGEGKRDDMKRNNKIAKLGPIEKKRSQSRNDAFTIHIRTKGRMLHALPALTRPDVG